MKTFKVSFWYTVYGTAVHIEAESKEEAEKWLFEEVQADRIAPSDLQVNQEICASLLGGVEGMQAVHNAYSKEVNLSELIPSELMTPELTGVR